MLEQTFEILGFWFVLATFQEVALLLLFSWRHWRERLDGRGLKTVVSVLVAGLIVYGYGLDLLADLMTVYGREASVGMGGQLLSTLLVAGGSGRINTVVTRLFDFNKRETP